MFLHISKPTKRHKPTRCFRCSSVTKFSRKSVLPVDMWMKVTFENVKFLSLLNYSDICLSCSLVHIFHTVHMIENGSSSMSESSYPSTTIPAYTNRQPATAMLFSFGLESFIYLAKTNEMYVPWTNSYCKYVKCITN